MQSRTVSGYAHMLRLGELTTLCYTLLYLASLHLVARAEDVGRGYGYVDTTALSSILDRLTNRTVYDKRLRPRYGDKPVDVGITIHVSSISAVSEVDMDFTLDFYMRQNWQDPRLAFEPLETGSGQKISSLTVGVDYMDKLWKPDTFFPNEKKSFFHTATTHNSFLRIDSDGTVATSQRLTVTATCPMKLQLFPMDSQRCKLEIESYGYSTLNINYEWCGVGTAADCRSVKLEASAELPSYTLSDHCVGRTVATTASGSYSRLAVIFIFSRESGFYMLQIFVPAGLVVGISWVSFWINRDSAPSRTIIGVMTVLTETHLMTGTNRRLPPVSYIKAVDIYLGFCYLLVVFALIEYACVAYTKKKNEDRRRRQKKSDFKPPSLQTPDLLQDARLAECTCNAQQSIVAIVKKPSKFCIRHSHIDIAARIIFPSAFFIFNVVFWIVLLLKANRMPYTEASTAQTCNEGS